MPEKVERFPGAWSSTIDWEEIASGGVYLFSEEELDEHNVTAATLRTTAHNYAKAKGFKFRTRLVEGEGLYIARKEQG